MGIPLVMMNGSRRTRSAAPPTIVLAVRGMLGRLIGFFALTQAELLGAGIVLGRMEQGR